MANTLFGLIDEQRKQPDPCAARHGGNAQSVAAFERISHRLNHDQAEVYAYVRLAGLNGATLKEFSAYKEKGANHYSGRFFELSQKGMIADSGRRRDGARVWVAKEVLLPTDGR